VQSGDEYVQRVLIPQLLLQVLQLVSLVSIYRYSYPFLHLLYRQHRLFEFLGLLGRMGHRTVPHSLVDFALDPSIRILDRINALTHPMLQLMRVLREGVSSPASLERVGIFDMLQKEVVSGVEKHLHL